MLTHGVIALGPITVSELLELVQEFTDFNEDNDPYGEHDFGRIDYQEKRFFWKIDYYDTEYKFGSEQPENPSLTRRVLTLMLASEY